MTVEPEPRLLAADLPGRLDELTLQMISIVKADTCAILLLDDDRRFLTVRAPRASTRRSSARCPFRSGRAWRATSSLQGSQS